MLRIAGFGYTFFSEKLRDYKQPRFNEFSGNAGDFSQPLIHQPGEAWEYSVRYRFYGAGNRC